MAYKTISARISGKSVNEYRVVVAKNPSETVLFAANELISYLNKATGFKQELVYDESTASDAEILVGATNRRDVRDDLGTDDFEIAAYPGQLSLYGGSDRGTLYAVYTYLEKYIGWRWFNYDAEIIRDKISHDIFAGDKIIERPVLNFRDCMYWDTKTRPSMRVKLKLNAENIPDNMGGCLGYNGFCHTFSSLCPPKEYFESHPEYFALRNGKRTPNQLCISNSDVLKIVTENALKRLRTSKKAFISISQNDNCDYCTCDRCRAIDEEEGSPSGAMLRFVNAVAEEIEKEFPDVLVDTLAYQYTRHLPAKTKPRHNVAVRLCSYECCFRHPLYDPHCESNTAFCKDVEDWSTVCNNLYIWDYVTDFSHFSMPLPNLSILRENMRFFADHNTKGMLTLGAHTGLGADLCELKTSLLCKLLWNPYMSEEEYEYHIEDFLEGFYGKGWQYIREYISILNDATYGEHIHCFSHPYGYFEKFAPHLDEVFSLFDKAEALAETPEQKKRVRIARIAPAYISICFHHDERKNAGGESAEKLLCDKKQFLNEFTELGLRRCEWFNYDTPEKTNIDGDPVNW